MLFGTTARFPKPTTPPHATRRVGDLAGFSRNSQPGLDSAAAAGRQHPDFADRRRAGPRQTGYILRPDRSMAKGKPAFDQDNTTGTNDANRIIGSASLAGPPWRCLRYHSGRGLALPRAPEDAFDRRRSGSKMTVAAADNELGRVGAEPQPLVDACGRQWPHARSSPSVQAITDRGVRPSSSRRTGPVAAAMSRPPKQSGRSGTLPSRRSAQPVSSTASGSAGASIASGSGIASPSKSMKNR